MITVLELTELDVQVPDFSLEPESLWSKFSELSFGKDVDFGDQPGFSKKYYLRGQDELAVRKFFNSELRDFLENREEVHLECHRNRLLLYKRREALAISELRYLEKFAEDLVAILSTKKPG